MYSTYLKTTHGDHAGYYAQYRLDQRKENKISHAVDSASATKPSPRSSPPQQRNLVQIEELQPLNEKKAANLIKSLNFKDFNPKVKERLKTAWDETIKNFHLLRIKNNLEAFCCGDSEELKKQELNIFENMYFEINKAVSGKQENLDAEQHIFVLELMDAWKVLVCKEYSEEHCAKYRERQENRRTRQEMHTYALQEADNNKNNIIAISKSQNDQRIEYGGKVSAATGAFGILVSAIVWRLGEELENDFSKLKIEGYAYNPEAYTLERAWHITYNSFAGLMNAATYGTGQFAFILAKYGGWGVLFFVAIIMMVAFLVTQFFPSVKVGPMGLDINSRLSDDKKAALQAFAEIQAPAAPYQQRLQASNTLALSSPDNSTRARLSHKPFNNTSDEDYID